MNDSDEGHEEQGQPFGKAGPQLPGPLIDKLELARHLLDEIRHDLGVSPFGPGGEPVLPPGSVPLDPRPVLDYRSIIDAINGIKVDRQPGIRIGGVEMTQSTQFFNYDKLGTGAGPDNSIPLIANKELVLRVFVELRPNAGYVPATVTGRVRFGGREFSPLNGPLAVRPAAQIRRANLSDTLNFRIPAALCTGTRTFTVRAYDAAKTVYEGIGIYADGTTMGFASTSDTMSVTFRDVPPLRVSGVLINYAGPGFDLPAPTGVHLVETLARILPMFPIHGFDFGPCVSTPWGDDMKIESGTKYSGWDSLITYITNLRSASTVRTYYVGLLPPKLSAQLGINQLGQGRPGVAIAAQDNTRAMSHELGHATSLQHVDAGGAPGPFDTSYPKYRDGTLQFGSVGEVGINTVNMARFDPVSATDLMTYFDPPEVTQPASTWISPYHYQRMRDMLVATDGTADLQIIVAITATAMLLNFRLHRDNSVELLPSYPVTGVKASEATRRTRNVMVDLIGRDGEILRSHRCHEHMDYQDPDGPFLDFHEVIAWPDNVAAIAIVREGRASERIHIAEQSAEVRLEPMHRMEERGDLARLRWSAGSGAESHNAMIRYSNDDGQTWQALAAGVTDSNYVVNLALLPGGERCRLQVIVAAGLRGTQVTSEVFTVPRKPRSAVIAFPRDGQVFRLGEPVVFAGGGYSPDGGVCDQQEVVWHSHLDALLGLGYQVIRDDLQAGTHRISLTLPNGVRGESTSSVWITILGQQETSQSDCDTTR